MQSLLKRSAMFSVAVFMTGLLFGSAARAEDTPAQKPGVSDEDLEAFAKAYVEVDKIRLALEPSLRNTQDPQQLKSIQQEARVKMEKAVEDQGLTSESYKKIFDTVKDDAELRDKTLKLIQEQQTQ